MFEHSNDTVADSGAGLTLGGLEVGSLWKAGGKDNVETKLVHSRVEVGSELSKLALAKEKSALPVVRDSDSGLAGAVSLDPVARLLTFKLEEEGADFDRTVAVDVDGASDLLSAFRVGYAGPDAALQMLVLD